MKSILRIALACIMLTILFICACAAPSPPAFQISSLSINPSEVIAGGTVIIAVEVKNIGGSSGSHILDLSLDGAKIQTKSVKVEPNKTEVVSFTVVKDVPKGYSVQVNNLSGILRVLRPAKIIVDNLIISPKVAGANKTVTITAKVSNTGEVKGSYSATLLINKQQKETKELTLNPMGAEKINFTFASDKQGIYNIEVGGLSGVLIVNETGDALASLNASYPELYEELLKLPDLKEIDARDKQAIEYIVSLAINPQYKQAFESMLAEGMKDKREYCTPLEALLWISYDRDFDYISSQIKNYSLSKLILDAWKNTTESDNYKSKRWENYEDVKKRVNSPELVNLFINNYVTFDMGRSEVHPQGSTTTYKVRKGVCRHAAYISTDFLSFNGYDAKNITVLYASNQGHTVGTVKEDGKISIVVDFRGDKRPIKGTFETYDKVVSYIADSYGWSNIFMKFVENNYDLARRNKDLE